MISIMVSIPPILLLITGRIEIKGLLKNKILSTSGKRMWGIESKISKKMDNIHFSSQKMLVNKCFKGVIGKSPSEGFDTYSITSFG
jgi:hypothetical protein